MAAQGRLKTYEATVDAPSVPANTSVELAVTIPGVLSSDRFVGAQMLSTLDTGLGLVGGFVSADNTVTLRWLNATAGALNPASGIYDITLFRGDDGSGDASLGGGPDWAG